MSPSPIHRSNPTPTPCPTGPGVAQRGQADPPTDPVAHADHTDSAVSDVNRAAESNGSAALPGSAAPVESAAAAESPAAGDSAAPAGPPGSASSGSAATGATRATGPVPYRRVALGLLTAFGIGVLISGQSRINGELGHRVGDGLVAANVSFGSGLLFLLLLLAVVPAIRRGVRRLWDTVRGQLGTADAPRLRPWHYLGGICGAYLVTTQSITVGLLGVAVFTVSVVAGQALSSLVVDRLGLGPGGIKPVTATRILGALLALGAVVLSVADELGTGSTLFLAALPALAGVGIAWQQAVNGRVGAAAIDPTRPRQSGVASSLVAALVNFGVGTAVLLVALGVDLVVRGLPAPLPTSPVLYLGGVMGVAFITLSAAIVPLTGVLLLGLGSVAGQLVGAVVLDAVLPAAQAQLNATTLAGTTLALVAVIIAALPGRRRQHP